MPSGSCPEGIFFEPFEGLTTLTGGRHVHAETNSKNGCNNSHKLLARFSVTSMDQRKDEEYSNNRLDLARILMTSWENIIEVK